MFIVIICKFGMISQQTTFEHRELIDIQFRFQELEIQILVLLRSNNFLNNIVPVMFF